MAGVKSQKGGTSIVRKRYLNEQEVKPCLYNGEFGKYITGVINDNIVMDTNGRPMQFSKIGQLGEVIRKR